MHARTKIKIRSLTITGTEKFEYNALVHQKTNKKTKKPLTINRNGTFNVTHANVSS